MSSKQSIMYESFQNEEQCRWAILNGYLNCLHMRHFELICIYTNFAYMYKSWFILQLCSHGFKKLKQLKIALFKQSFKITKNYNLVLGYSEVKGFYDRSFAYYNARRKTMLNQQLYDVIETFAY